MARWIKHDGSDAMPYRVAETDVLEIEAGTWGGNLFIAGLVTGWNEVARYRQTGQTVSAAFLAAEREALA